MARLPRGRVLLASLVEMLPAQVGVEITLTPGIDIAPRMIALPNIDGACSEIESIAWSGLFIVGQRVMVDGQSLPLTLANVRSGPLSEMTNGHAEIVVHVTVDLGPLARDPRTITCVNPYNAVTRR